MNGLTRKDGRLGFLCACGCGRLHAPNGKPGGITVAWKIGWRKINGRWSCPFCNGLVRVRGRRG